MVATRTKGCNELRERSFSMGRWGGGGVKYALGIRCDFATTPAQCGVQFHDPPSYIYCGLTLMYTYTYIHTKWLFV